ncbi:tetratricopeptide repeat protein [Catellatospora sichuanensis]|uniref:tetratricopeptide repeat protein n=1 Tax=Catellatospora sichuanensis TaxID=1969805 RepID=UPI001181EF32|nr:sel1 repeat family protein [Catellatospora sichuanensis]
MLFLVFGSVLAVWGMSVDNGTLTTVGWIAWAVGIIVIWVRSAGRFGMRAIMTRRMLRDMDLMRAAAEKGDPVAMRALGSMLKVTGDWDGAEHWLSRSAWAGDREAMFDMGRLADQRNGLAAAEQWFRMASEAGHPVARMMFVEGGLFNRDGTS